MFTMGGWRIGVVMSWEGGGRMGEGREIKIRVTIKIKIYGDVKDPGILCFLCLLWLISPSLLSELCTLNSELFSKSVLIRVIRGQNFLLD